MHFAQQDSTQAWHKVLRMQWCKFYPHRTWPDFNLIVACKIIPNPHSTTNNMCNHYTQQQKTKSLKINMNDLHVNKETIEYQGSISKARLHLDSESKSSTRPCILIYCRYIKQLEKIINFRLPDKLIWLPPPSVASSNKHVAESAALCLASQLYAKK